MSIFQELIESMGGIVTVSFASIYNILNWPKLENGKYVSEPTLKTGESYFTLNVFRFAEYTETPEETDAGLLFSSTLTVYLENKSLQYTEYFDGGYTNPSFAIITYANGVKQILGSPGYPLKYQRDVSSGRFAPDKNISTITLKGSMPYNAPFLV